VLNDRLRELRDADIVTAGSDGHRLTHDGDSRRRALAPVADLGEALDEAHRPLAAKLNSLTPNACAAWRTCGISISSAPRLHSAVR
jgi:hypothetical protein